MATIDPEFLFRMESKNKTVILIIHHGVTACGEK